MDQNQFQLYVYKSVNTRAASSLGSLQSRLKTELFTSAYPTYDNSMLSRRFWFTPGTI